MGTYNGKANVVRNKVHLEIIATLWDKYCVRRWWKDSRNYWLL